MRIDGCVYPDCFHCPFEDCVAPAVCFPGESRKNEEAAGFSGTGKRRSAQRGKNTRGNRGRKPQDARSAEGLQGFRDR